MPPKIRQPICNVRSERPARQTNNLKPAETQLEQSHAGQANPDSKKITLQTIPKTTIPRPPPRAVHPALFKNRRHPRSAQSGHKQYDPQAHLPPQGRVTREGIY